MAILLDFHSTIISHIMIMSRDNDNFYIDEQTLRQKILYSIKKYKKLFGREYGQILISCDGKDYWRKTLFPYYKIGRKTHREESNIDWDEIHNFMDLIKEEIKVHTHYPVVQVNEAESDDVIAILAEHLAGQKNIILSRDRDFKQLHYIPGLRQYDPIGDKFIEIDDPKKFLFEHICKGDAGDSIPNFLMEDNAIAVKTRQKPIMQKKVEVWYESYPDGLPETNYFARNRKMIDFRCIPKIIKTLVLAEYEREINKPKPNLIKYFMNFGVSEFIDEMIDFQ